MQVGARDSGAGIIELMAVERRSVKSEVGSKAKRRPAGR